MQILRIEPEDYDAVLALNEESVPHVNLIGAAELQWFVENAACTRIVKIDDRLAGFLIGLRPGLEYASPNYQWFCDNYDDFAYIDRVIVSTWARRRGVADALYAAFSSSQSDAPVMTCEVNIRPSNEGSMLFHKQMGFRQVSSHEIDGGDKEVALMEKLN
jgi:predicted GNAT superfamily acetyltransferase